MWRQIKNLLAFLTVLPFRMDMEYLADSARLMWLFPLVGALLGGYLGNALVSGFSSAPAQVQALRAGTDIVSFRAFSAAPPGTLGDGYLRMAHFTEEVRK